MPKKSRKKFKRKQTLAFFGEMTLLNFSEWMVCVMLMGVIYFTTYQLGGLYAETQLIVVWGLGGGLVLHALTRLLARAERKETAMGAWGLVFLPLILFILINWWFVAQATWVARADALLVLQAYVVFWVVLHGFKSRNQIWFAFVVLMLLGLVNVFWAFGQYFRDSGELVSLMNPLDGRSVAVAGQSQYEMQSSGTFATPVSFAAFMLLALFPAAMGAFARYLSTGIRWFCGYLALLFLVGILLSMSSGSIYALIPSALLLPWIARAKGKTLWYQIGGVAACGVLTVLILFWFAPGFQSRFMNLNEAGGESARPVMQQAAWQSFTGSPVIGNGLGSYRFDFEHYRPTGFNENPSFAHNDYLQTLSEMGVVGFLLLFVPVGIICGVGFRCWLQCPELYSFRIKQRIKWFQNYH